MEVDYFTLETREITINNEKVSVIRRIDGNYMADWIAHCINPSDSLINFLKNGGYDLFFETEIGPCYVDDEELFNNNKVIFIECKRYKGDL